MPTATVKDLGNIGYISDPEAVTVPPNGWDFLQNILCKDGSIKAFPGHETHATVTPTVQRIETVKTGSKSILAYAGGTSTYSYYNSVETVLSTNHSVQTWDSCVLGGVAIFNPGVSPPYYWGGSGSALPLPYDSLDAANVVYWDDPSADLTARIIRSFKFHLFAFNLTDCDGWNGRKMIISHPAEPGSLPITWDVTNPDYDATEWELSETPGEIIDALALRDVMVVYKTDAIYTISYTGDRNQYLWNVRPQTYTRGIYARGCVCDLGGVHFVVGDSDIYLYDGVTPKGIGDRRVRDLFFGDVSRENKDLAFVTYQESEGLVWLCYPTTGNSSCNKALVWSVEDNTWSERDLPGVLCSAYAQVDRSSGYTWDTLPYATWDEWGDDPPGPEWATWDALTDFYPPIESLILGGPQTLYEMNRGNQASGVNLSCIARRTQLLFDDTNDLHLIVRIRPIAQGDAFNVRLGYHTSLNSAVTWSAYQAFDPDTAYELNFSVMGRPHAVEFQSEADVSWNVSGYHIDYELAGTR